jgi:hypothetical protein
MLGPAHRFGGVGVLALPGDAELGRRQVGKVAHQLAFVGILQAIQEHVVEGLAVAQAVAAAGAGQHVGGVGHGLHAAGQTHVAAAGQQHVMDEHGGLHARAAHLGQGGGRHRVRQAGADDRLAGRRLLDAGHQTAAEDGFVHLPAQLAEAAEGATDGGAGQLWGVEGGKAALEGADGGATGCYDHDGISHGVLRVYLL